MKQGLTSFDQFFFLFQQDVNVRRDVDEYGNRDVNDEPNIQWYDFFLFVSRFNYINHKTYHETKI